MHASGWLAGSEKLSSVKATLHSDIVSALMRRFINKTARRHGYGRKDSNKSPHRSSTDSDAGDTGLKVIYAATSCRVDIVAIHGDGGHYKKSWTHPENQVFWLRDLLPRVVPDSRILSFGYSASKSSYLPAEQVSWTLIKELSRLRSTTDENRPILFLAHSFGVLLLKGALATSSSSGFSSIIFSTRGIMFFGSPPDIGNMLQRLVSSLPMAQSASPDFIAMQKDLTWLQKTESDYSELEKLGEFDVIYFSESPGQKGGHDTGNSSIPTDNEQGKLVRMRKTHGKMIKFLGAEDENFHRVKECIEQIMTKSKV